MHKFKKKHDCQKCKQNVQNNLTKDNVFSFFKVKKSQENLFGNLIVPNNNFIANIESLDKIFNDNFKKVGRNSGLSVIIYDILSLSKFDNACVCFPQEYLLKFYIRYKINYSLTFFNNELLNKWTRTKNIKLRIICNL